MDSFPGCFLKIQLIIFMAAGYLVRWMYHNSFTIFLFMWVFISSFFAITNSFVAINILRYMPPLGIEIFISIESVPKRKIVELLVLKLFIYNMLAILICENCILF